MGIQTRVVATSDNYRAVFVISLLIALTSYFMFKTAAHGTLDQYMLTFGTGGATGISLATKYKTQISKFIERCL